MTMTSLEQTADFIINHRCQFVLITGATGTGKTTLAHIIAKKLNIGVRSISFNAQTTSEDLLGSYFIRNNATEFQAGPLTSSVQGAMMFLGEECELIQNDSCLTAFYELMDDRQQLSLPTGVVKMPETFRLVLCSNSTDRIPKALLNRMYIVQLNYLEPREEAALLIERTGISNKAASTLATIAEISRKTLKEGISTRTLLIYGKPFANANSAEQVDWLEQMLLSSFALQSERDAVYSAVALKLKGIIPAIAKPPKRGGCQ